jgi:hypothetical protein
MTALPGSSATPPPVPTPTPAPTPSPSPASTPTSAPREPHPRDEPRTPHPGNDLTSVAGEEDPGAALDLPDPPPAEPGTSEA